MDLTSLTVLAADLMWVSLFHYALTNPPAGWVSTSVFLTIILFSSNLISRLFSASKVKPWIQRIIFIVWMLVVLLISFQLLFFFKTQFSIAGLFLNPINGLVNDQLSWNLYWHFVIVLLVLWRGSSLNAKSLELFSANSGFQLGILMFLVFGFSFGWILHAQPTYNFILFLLFSMIGMGASRLIGIGILRTGKTNKVSSTWPLWLLIASFSIVTISIVIGIIANQILARAITTVFILVMAIFSILMFIIMYPIIWLAQKLVELIKIIFHGKWDISKLLEGFANRVTDLSQEGANNDSIINFIRSVQPWVIGIIILVIFSLVALSMSALKKQKQKQIRLLSLDADSPISAKQRRTGRGLGLLDRMRLTRRHLAAERIRRVYVRLMDLCVELNKPRPHASTPLEFLPILCDLIPGVTPELTLITQSYNRIRYGELPENEAEVRSIESAWRKVRENGTWLIRVIKKDRKKANAA